MKNNRPIIVCLFHVYSHPELWNVNSFKRSKTFKPNFTPRKACKLQQSWHILNKKGMLLTLSNLTRLVNNIFKRAWFLFLCSTKLFTPTSQHFHTDISVISVTFCNFVLIWPVWQIVCSQWLHLFFFAIFLLQLCPSLSLDNVHSTFGE